MFFMLPILGQRDRIIKKTKCRAISHLSVSLYNISAKTTLFFSENVKFVVIKVSMNLSLKNLFWCPTLNTKNTATSSILIRLFVHHETLEQMIEIFDELKLCVFFH